MGTEVERRCVCGHEESEHGPLGGGCDAADCGCLLFDEAPVDDASAECVDCHHRVAWPLAHVCGEGFLCAACREKRLAVEARRAQELRTATRAPAIKTMCAWCGAITKDGPGAPVSHGICDECAAQVRAGALQEPAR